jgi:hypothetical protein
LLKLVEMGPEKPKAHAVPILGAAVGRLRDPKTNTGSLSCRVLFFPEYVVTGFNPLSLFVKQWSRKFLPVFTCLRSVPGRASVRVSLWNLHVGSKVLLGVSTCSLE